MNLKDHYIEYGRSLIYRECDYKVASRQVHRWQTFGPIPYDEFADNEGFELEDCNYSQVKISQLKNYYYNKVSVDQSIEAFEKRLRKKSKNSSSFSLQHNAKKGWTQNDFCMQSGILTYNAPTWDLTFLYRTTEFFQKFRGDLIFFHQVILPRFKHFSEEFESDPNEVLLFFPSIVMHPMFMVYWLEWTDDWEYEMKELYKRNPSLTRTFLKTCQYMIGDRSIRYKAAYKVHKWFIRKPNFMEFIWDHVQSADI